MTDVRPIGEALNYDNFPDSELGSELTQEPLPDEPDRLSKLCKLGRYAGWAVLGLTVAVAGGIDAVEYGPPAQVSAPIIGSHATVRVQLGGDRVSVRPPVPGGIQKQSQFHVGPIALGIHVEPNYNDLVVTNPDGTFNIGQGSALLSDLTGKDRGQTIPGESAIVSATEHHYEKLGGGTALAIVLAEGLGAGYVKWRRGQLLDYETPAERTAAQNDRRVPQAIGMAATGLMMVATVVPAGLLLTNPAHDGALRPDQVLEEIGIHGVQLSGPLKMGADKIIPKFNTFNKQVDAFYDADVRSLDSQFRQRYGESRLPKEPGTLRLIFFDDVQGQAGTLSVVGEAAKDWNADLIIDGGDLTATGTTAEMQEINNLHDQAPDTPADFETGHHDPKAEAMKSMVKGYKGYQVTNDEIQSVGGLNIMGLNATDIIPFGGKSYVLKPAFPGETADQANQQLAATATTKACASKKPVIAVAHEQSIGKVIAAANCPSVPLVLTGASYTWQNPVAYPNTTLFVSGSTGGHSPNGQLQLFNMVDHPATFQEITISSKNYQVISSNLITMSAAPDTQVTIQSEIPLTALPRPVTVPAQTHNHHGQQ